MTTSCWTQTEMRICYKTHVYASLLEKTPLMGRISLYFSVSIILCRGLNPIPCIFKSPQSLVGNGERERRWGGGYWYTAKEVSKDIGLCCYVVFHCCRRIGAISMSSIHWPLHIDMVVKRL